MKATDVLICSLETTNHKIPIEVKIYADDQDRQCFDYSKHSRNSELYYLTLDGDPPSEESADELIPLIKDKKIVGYQGVRLISFSEDIIKWLDCCLARTETIKIAPIREILLQFKDTLNELTGQVEGGEKMDIVNTLTASAENMRSAVNIERELPEAKAHITLNFFSELKQLFEKAGWTTLFYDEDIIKGHRFLRGSQTFPLSIEIKKWNYNLTATLCFEIYETLCYSFAFFERNKESGEYLTVTTERVKSEHPKVFKSVTNAVYDTMGKDKKKTEDTIFWDFLYDDKGRKFDFKSFSEPCVKLTENYKQQAKKIFDELNGYIDTIYEKI